MIRAWCALLLVLLAFATPAFADGPEPGHATSDVVIEAPPDLAVVATPVFGDGTIESDRWTEIFVSLANQGTAPRRGEAVICGETHPANPGSGCTHAPFEVTPGATVEMRVPVQCGGYGEVTVRLVDERGATLFERRLSPAGATHGTIVEVGGPSALKARLEGYLLGAHYEPWDVHPSTARGYGFSVPHPATLFLAGTLRSSATGEPILPRRAASYASVATVLTPSDALTRVSAAELSALTTWVLAGGTLAVVVARPEDLRHPTLVSLLGGEAMPGPVTPEATRSIEDRVLPRSPGGPPQLPGGRLGPEVEQHMVGYAGGNLRASAFGATAPYGLGEVHLLAFDPSHKPGVDSAWVQQRVGLLVRRASERQANVLFRLGEEPMPTSEVFEFLDPNESSRSSVAAVVVFLCVYAILAGPVNFAFWRRRKAPIRALVTLLVASLATFVAVVVVGLLAKGVSARSGHLTFVEAGAGMTHGSARRYRAFYVGRERQVDIQPSHAAAVVAPHRRDEEEMSRFTYAFDREALRMASVTLRPWQTMLVREDGVASLGRGIALVRDGSETLVVNRTGRDLLALVLSVPGSTTAVLPRLADGKTARFGDFVRVAVAESLERSRVEWHTFRAGDLGSTPVGNLPGIGEAWQAVDAATFQPGNWFPDDVPVLLAQIEGGEGVTSDSGIPLEQDRLLVRVVGYGGEP